MGSDTEAPAAADLVAALGALEDLKRDRTATVETKGGGSYSYAYTDLAGVLGEVRPVLAAHRFAIVQPVETDADRVCVSTELVHATGVRYASPAISMRQPDQAQALGSLLTYLRRYSLLAALGLATEDDDGKAATTAATLPAMWPARTIKGGMVTEIATRVTFGDVERATELAALAWSTFALEGVDELPAGDAREKIDAAVELAHQEAATDPELAHQEAATDPELEEGDVPRAPWTTDANMRADLGRRGISNEAARAELRRVAADLGVNLPGADLGKIRREGDPRVVAAFAAWVRNHDELEP